MRDDAMWLVRQSLAFTDEAEAGNRRAEMQVPR